MVPQGSSRARHSRESAVLACTLAFVSTFMVRSAHANSMPINIWGGVDLRPLGWVLVAMGGLGLFLSAAFGAITLWPGWRRLAETNLLVISRGVVAVIALTTLLGSGSLFLLGAAVASGSGVLSSVLFVSLVSVFPCVVAFLFAAELVYASRLYARVGRAGGGTLSNILSVVSLVLALPCLVAGCVFAGFGFQLMAGLAKVTTLPGTLTFGLGGTVLSASLGLVGLCLAMFGKLDSTTAVLGRGVAMFVVIGVFAVSAFLLHDGANSVAKTLGFPPAPELDGFAVWLLLGLVGALVALEFGIGAVLHLRNRERSPAAQMLGLGSAGLSIASFAGASVALALAAAAPVVLFGH